MSASARYDPDGILTMPVKRLTRAPDLSDLYPGRNCHRARAMRVIGLPRHLHAAAAESPLRARKYARLKKLVPDRVAMVDERLTSNQAHARYARLEFQIRTPQRGQSGCGCRSRNRPLSSNARAVARRKREIILRDEGANRGTPPNIPSVRATFGEGVPDAPNEERLFSSIRPHVGTRQQGVPHKPRLTYIGAWQREASQALV